MSRIVAAVVVLTFAPRAIVAGDPPLVEKYLHAGDLARGEVALEAALEKAPRDDQVRFGLGFLRIVKSVERVGQSLHHYGYKSEYEWLPGLRLPVPVNREPAAISYRASRRVVEDFCRDLATAEATLAGLTDDRVTLPLRVAKIRLDLTGSGKAEASLTDVVKGMMGRLPDVLRDNPELLIKFDRGDVAWFRAYCHLVMGVCELYLAVDSEGPFLLHGHLTFTRVVPKLSGNEEDAVRQKLQGNWVIPLREPERLGRFRRHFVEVCRLNRETWRFIRAETDDDHEWLPNPRQKGVLGLPVREEMITTWLRMIDELEAVLEGKVVIPFLGRGTDDPELGFNVKKFLDDPPVEIDVMSLINGQNNKYAEKGKLVDFQALSAAFSMFSQPLMMGYAAWFN